jgi:transcriptional regulator with XRE-family HTH domain
MKSVILWQRITWNENRSRETRHSGSGDLSLQMSSTTPRKYRDAFVGRVKTARTDAGYTQRAVAMLLGVEKSTYNNYERGRGKEPPTLMPLHLIERFCVLCQVPMDWLVTGKEMRRTRGPRTQQKQTAVKSLRGRPEARLRAFTKSVYRSCWCQGVGPAPQPGSCRERHPP